MKNPKLLRMSGILFLLFLVFNSVNVHAQDGQQVPKMTPDGTGYLQFLPAGYSSSTELYPCIIFYHGHGEIGNGSPAALTNLLKNGTPKFINNGATMCFTVNGKNECFIVLSPQLSSGNGWLGPQIFPFIDYAKANYRIDPDRIYLTGLSMGGGAAWRGSYATENEPNYIAAIAPAGTMGDFQGGKITAQRSIPVWDFYGSADTEYTQNEVLSPINGMLTVVNHTPDPIYSLVAGGAHNATTWDKVYSPTNTYYNPNVYQWFLTQKRGVNTGANPITINTGPDITLTLPTNSVNIAATASTTKGSIVSYNWTKAAGPWFPPANMTNATTSTLSLTGLPKATYIFRLQATNTDGTRSWNDVTVIVKSASTNVAPTVNAGTDKLITLPTNSTVLTGSASDTDGTIASTLWSQISGPNVAPVVGASSTTLTANNLIVGAYVFRLAATDNLGAVTSDDVTVTVNPAPNVAPLANAGEDKLITLPANSTVLTGSVSDTDGTITSTLWSQVSGPGVATLTGESSTTLTASNLIVGSYVFRLTATDNLGAVASDNATVTVNPAPNVAPVANASVDKLITLPANSTVLTGSGSDTDGTITTYAWAKVSGPTAVLGGEATSTLTLSALTEGVYVFQLTVTDNQSAIGIDDVTVTVLADPIQTPTWINKLYVSEDAAGTLTKLSGALGGANSQEVLAASADGWVQVEIDQNERNRTIGLSDVEVDYTRTTIDYGIEFSTVNNNVFTWQLGVRSYSHNYVIGEVYRIERLSNTILFKLNGATFRTASVASTSSLIVDVSMENAGARIYNTKISFGSNNSPGGRAGSQTASEEIAKNKVSENGNLLEVYPNPMSTTLFISLDKKTEGPLKVRILNSAGKLEWEGTTSSDSEVVSIDLASTRVSSGIKIISIVKSNGEVVHKRLQKID